MKKLLCIFSLFCFVYGNMLHAQHNNSELPTSINDDGTAPDASAILDVQSTNKGILIPRMTTAQRTAIAAPGRGLLVFDTSTGGFWFHDGTAWADLSAGGGADADWTETANGIYHNEGNVSINTSTIDGNSNLYVFRPLGDYGADKASIYGYRSGYSSVADSGGVHLGHLGIDAAIKGFSNWGNQYTAGVAGHSYLDYANSAAVLGGQQAGNIYGALGFRDSTQIWAGYFDGDIRFRPETSYTPELYLDIVREYQNQGEFGQWHELYVLPNGRNVNAPDYDFYYLGDDTHHFDGLYCNAVNPENSLFINGNTIISGANDLGVGTSLPGMKVHVKQDISNRGIRTEHQTASDYWDTGIGLTTKNYKFYYNNVSKADVASTDGAYIQPSDKNLKKNIEYLDNVLPRVLRLQPAKYHYTDASSASLSKSHGFIAQEVEAVFPEIVRRKEDGTKALAYDDFAILAIQAIQEQQNMIEEQAQENETLAKKVAEMEEELAKIKAMLKQR